jgi:rhodanese-related sulfurtransferase
MMKSAVALSVSLLFGSVGVGLGGPQEHPATLAGAPETSAQKLQEELSKGAKILIIDVRSPKEYAAGHIPGAQNIPLEALDKRISELKVPKDTTVVTVCDHGGRSSRAVVELQKLGYKTSSFCRLESWKKAGYKIETEQGKPSSSSQIYKFTCHHYCLSDKQTSDLEQRCECACGKPYRECMKGG